jgi:cold shock CspA family protein/ribosome-associated translation inhibitor RaiA
MQLPLNISYRNVAKDEAIDGLIRDKASKLDEVCDHIMGCHVAVEKTHENPDSGSPFRVRIDLTVPPSHELAVTKNPVKGVQYQPLEAVIRSAFEAARRQLMELNDRQQDQVKSHPQQEMRAIVVRLFPEEGYGFLKTVDGREIYFHQGSVLNDDFERLEIGTGVRFFAHQHSDLPEASTVQIVSKPGAHVGSSEADGAAQIAAPPRAGSLSEGIPAGITLVYGD